MWLKLGYYLSDYVAQCLLLETLIIESSVLETVMKKSEYTFFEG